MSSPHILRALQSSNNLDVTAVSVLMVMFLCFLAVIVLTYAVGRFRDRASSLISLNNNDATTETKQKVIWLRITPEERTQILKAFFEKRIFYYKNEAGCLDRVSGEADVEKGEAVAVNIGESVKPLTEPTRRESSGELDSSKISGQGNSQDEGPTIDASRQSEAQIKVLNNEEKEAAFLKEEKHFLAEVDDMDHERTCCVCLIAYEEGNQLMTGTQCNHVFHYACCMAWLNKNVQCPYCRRAMITDAELLQTAWDVLGLERFLELGNADILNEIQQGSSTIVIGVSPSATISTTSTSNRNDSGSTSHQEMIHTSR